MSPKDIQKRLNEVNGTMAIEGMSLSERVEDALRAVLSGEVTYQVRR